MTRWYRSLGKVQSTSITEQSNRLQLQRESSTTTLLSAEDYDIGTANKMEAGVGRDDSDSDGDDENWRMVKEAKKATTAFDVM